MKSRISFAYSSFDTSLHDPQHSTQSVLRTKRARHWRLTGTAPLWAGLQAQSSADHLGSNHVFALCADQQHPSADRWVGSYVHSISAGEWTYFEKGVALRVLLKEHAAAVPVVRAVHIAFSRALDLVEVPPALRADAFDTLRGRIVERTSDVHCCSMRL